MHRNFDRRVEAIAPVEDTSLHPRLQSILDLCLHDNRQAWDLGANGKYVQRFPGPDEPVRSTHQILMGDPWGMTDVSRRDSNVSVPS